MTEIDKCRVDFEKYVKWGIREGQYDEFLKVGSPHWLDFKAGWIMATRRNEHD